MKDLIAIFAIVLIIALALRYIIKSKKRGIKCIGCPSASCCPSKNKNEACGVKEE